MDRKYKAICEKLGFDPMTHKRTLCDHENDSYVSPYSALTNEELDYLISYMKNNMS